MLTAALLAPQPLLGQALYPGQTIKLMVPNPPGGLPDTVGRIVGRRLQERLGQSVVIENRPGANGRVAVAALLGLPADGYTLLVTDGSILTINPLLYANLAYGEKDILPIVTLARAPLFLAVHPKVPAATLGELIAYAKAHPGKLNYGSSGVGSTHHLSMEAMNANVFLSKGRDVADPERMKDQRVGSPGKLPGQFVAACGGRPAVMTIEKFHDAYEDGALDMSVAGFGAVAAYSLQKFVDTVTFTHHTPITFFLVINEKTWQSLSPAHQATIEQAATKVETEIAGFQVASESRAGAFAEKHNMKLQELTPDQVTDGRACSAGMLADYIDRVGDSAWKIMGAYGRLRTDPCCSAAPGDATFTRR